MVAVNDEHQPHTRESRRQATIAAIIAATTRLSESRGFDDISILDICIEADLSISSFYLRFPSKESLLAEIHSRYLDDFRASLWEQLSTVDFAMPDHEAVIGAVVGKYLTLRVDYANRFRTMALAEQQHPALADNRRRADRVAIDVLADRFAARFEDSSTQQEVRTEVAFITRVIALVAQDLTALGRTFLPDDLAADPALVERLTHLASAYIRSIVPAD